MDRSFARALSLALALHAGVAVAGRWARSPAVALPRVDEARWEVSVVETPDPRPEHEPRAGSLGPGGTRSAVATSRPSSAAGRGPTARSTPGLEGAGPVESAASPSPSASEPAPAPERPVDLGLGGIWARPALPDRPKGGWQTGAQAAGGLGEGLEGLDRERGLGRGGVVATLARSAAIGSGPTEGEATFSVQADREGRVSSVTLVEGRGGSWSEVTAALRRALGQKRLRVPPGANGLAVQVLVRARVQLPSGSKPGEAIRGRGAGAEFDVADIGARPARVVSARVTSERLL